MDDVMGKSQMFEWFPRFKKGKTSTDDQPRSGRPSMAQTDENVARIREIIMEDRQQTIEKVVELSGIT